MHRWVWLVLACASCAPAHHSEVVAPSGTSRIGNLHAFARLYGVVRWFHPSDAAAATDWDRFAIEGARRVVDAPSQAALRATLTELFAQVAPTVTFAGPGETLTDAPALHPASTAGLDVVAWEHEGYGDSVIVSAYQSKRRHRARTVAAEGAAPFAGLSQAIDATPYRGAKVRLRAQVRADASGGGGQLWLRVDRPKGEGFFDNMDDRVITKAAWTDAEIVGTVDADASTLVFGPLVASGGAWFDDVELAVQDAHGAWQPIAIPDAGFEDTDTTKSWHAIGPTGWDITSAHERPWKGAASLHIAAKTTEITEELFDDAPRPGETVDIDLGSGLRARVPIALYSKDGHTLGDSAAPLAAPGSPPAGYDPIAGAADVIVAWNAIEHFWPYWQDVPLDWGRELDVALGEALADHSIDDHLATLQHLAVAAPDGHAGVSCPGETQQAAPPIALGWIENQAVVTASKDDRIGVGDVVTSIDGKPVTDVIAAAETRVSGSPQWKRVIVMTEIAAGPVGSTVTLHVQHAGAATDVALTRATDGRSDDVPAHPPIEQRANGVWYVDLGRAEMKDIDAAMDRLAAAPGVVLDMRGYPNSTHMVLAHVIAKAEDAKWMWLPKIIRPDHVAHAWDGVGWDMAPLAPHIAGKVAVLTGPRAISYAESVMGYAQAEKLQIFGEPSAGTNGNVAQIREPTGCKSIFTGMRVTRHDGSRHHLIGVQPTMTVTRTIAGVRAGKDEVLDAALAWIDKR